MKKLLSVFAVCAFTFSALAMTASASDYDGEMKELAETGESNYLQKAGEPDFSYSSGGLTISGRSANWNALDFLLEDKYDDGTYILTVGFKSETAQTFQIAKADSDWASIVTSDGDVTEAVLTAEIVISGGIWDVSPAQNRARLNTADGQTEDYTVTFISFAGQTAEETPVETTETPKPNVNTGAAGVAAVTGIAIAAATGIIATRKRK